MIHRIIVSLAISFIALLSLISSAVAGTAPDPTEQLRPLLDKIVAILTDPNLQGEENCYERRQRVMKVAKERFDFAEMSKRVLSSQWRSLSQQEQQNFTALFTTLLEHAYIGKIEDYSKQKVEFREQRIRDERAEVKTDIVDNNVVLPVSYIMILKGREWMVYDIVVEGVSLIRNYMEQFREIIRKDGYQSLLSQLKNKVNELEETAKPCPVDLTPKKS